MAENLTFRQVSTVQFVGFERYEDGSAGREYYASLYDGSKLQALPWGTKEFDCILVTPEEPSLELAEAFAEEIVRHPVDWVQTTGPIAEQIHDMVDESSVAQGVQAKVGDGKPMTSWDEEATSLEATAEVAKYFGGENYMLCLVVGDQADFDSFVSHLQRMLADFS